MHATQGGPCDSGARLELGARVVALGRHHGAAEQRFIKPGERAPVAGDEVRVRVAYTANHDRACAARLGLAYFQLWLLPAAIHSTAVASRRLRVSSVLASVIHSTYSRLWLGAKPWYVASARLFFRSAVMRSAGARSAGRGLVRRASFTPRSFSFAACFTSEIITRALGRSSTEPMRPYWPMALRSFLIGLPFSSSSSEAFQKPNTQ